MPILKPPALAALSMLAACSSSMPSSLRLPPPVEHSALQPCLPLVQLKAGDIDTLLDWIATNSAIAHDCRAKQHYLSTWIETSRKSLLAPQPVQHGPD